MLGRLIERLDILIGISATSELDWALLNERYLAVQRQLPWLYGILFANLFGLHLALADKFLLLRSPFAILLVVVAVRAVQWIRKRPRKITGRQAQRELRNTFFVANIFCASFCWWCISLYTGESGQQGIEVIMFASLAALGCCYALSSFPATGQVPLLVLALPLAVMAILSSRISGIGIGFSLVFLILVTLRLLKVHNFVFERLVSSRHETEIEKKRAIIAERIAVGEQSRFGAIANTDFLTGLSNRRAFLTALDVEIRSANRRMAIILFDLDGFKPINDTFGHQSGDAILIEVSQRLQVVGRESDIVARLGGDEFAIFHECETETSASTLASLAVESLGGPYSVDGRTLTISACAGFSFQEAGTDPLEAMRRADLALYSAKGHGRGRVAVFSEKMDQIVQRRASIERALLEPGVEDRIELAFQPIFHLETMELRGFEALARWQHSGLGWIPPSEFIPITEQIRVVEHLSDSLLARAAMAALAWPPSVRLSFNLSAVQLCADGCAETVLRIIADCGLSPARLQIEVTETALLADFASARRNLGELRQHGVRIVLDDFGAGYASIGYLREMNFDAVKLDGLLVSSLHCGNGLLLLRGVLALCSAMGQQCIAEHVETESQVKLLRELGCRYGQGFGLGMPMSAQEAGRVAAPRVLTLRNSSGFVEDFKRASGRS